MHLNENFIRNCTCFQLLCIRRSGKLCPYLMQRESQASLELEDFLTDNGSPLMIQSDNVRVMTSNCMKKNLRKERMQQVLTEPKYQNKIKSRRIPRLMQLNTACCIHYGSYCMQRARFTCAAWDIATSMWNAIASTWTGQELCGLSHRLWGLFHVTYVLLWALCGLLQPLCGILQPLCEIVQSPCWLYTLCVGCCR